MRILLVVLTVVAVASLAPAAHAYDGRFYIVVVRADPPGLAVFLRAFDTKQQCDDALAVLRADPGAAVAISSAESSGFTVGCLVNAVEWGRALEAKGVTVVWQNP